MIGDPISTVKSSNVTKWPASDAGLHNHNIASSESKTVWICHRHGMKPQPNQEWPVILGRSNVWWTDIRSGGLKGTPHIFATPSLPKWGQCVATKMLTKLLKID